MRRGVEGLGIVPEISLLPSLVQSALCLIEVVRQLDQDVHGHAARASVVRRTVLDHMGLDRGHGELFLRTVAELAYIHQAAAGDMRRAPRIAEQPLENFLQ